MVTAVLLQHRVDSDGSSSARPRVEVVSGLTHQNNFVPTATKAVPHEWSRGFKGDNAGGGVPEKKLLERPTAVWRNKTKPGGLCCLQLCRSTWGSCYLYNLNKTSDNLEAALSWLFRRNKKKVCDCSSPIPPLLTLLVPQSPFEEKLLGS